MYNTVENRTRKMPMPTLIAITVLPFSSDNVITNLSSHKLLTDGLFLGVQPNFIIKTGVFTSFEMIC